MFNFPELRKITYKENLQSNSEENKAECDSELLKICIQGCFASY